MTMADIELTQPLHERIYERIRDSIGDLMTDEDLKLLVDKAAEKAFFEPRITPPKNTYGPATQEEPWMVEQVRVLLKEQMNLAVTEWYKEHSEDVLKIIDEQVQRGFVQILASYFDNKMMSSMQDMRTQFNQAMTTNRY